MVDTHVLGIFIESCQPIDVSEQPYLVAPVGLKPIDAPQHLLNSICEFAKINSPRSFQDIPSPEYSLIMMFTINANPLKYPHNKEFN